MRGNTLVVGIHGHSGSGKSQMGEYLEETFPYPNANILFVHMADPLKLATAELLVGDPEAANADEWSDILHDRLYGSSAEREVPLDYGRCGELTIRRVLQVLGHLGRAYLHEDIWVETAHRVICDLESMHSHDNSMVVLIPDIRYANEVNYVLRERRGFIVDMREPIGYEHTDSHPSEAGLGQLLLARKYENTDGEGARILHANSARLVADLTRLKESATSIWNCVLTASATLNLGHVFGRTL